MFKRVVIATIVALALVGAGIAIGVSADGDWGHRDAVVVSDGGTGAADAGQTIVVSDGRDGPPFFFFPFGFVFFVLAVFLIVSLVRRGRGPWRNGPGGPRWLDDWHHRAHEDAAEGGPAA